MNYHQPVLIKETLNLLDIKPKSIYVDATLGNGGHTLEILKLGGIVYGIDQDPINIDIATKRIQDAKLNSNFIPIHSNFNQLEKIITSVIKQKIDGLLVDLGLSKNQQISQNRGFSFNDSTSLDMRLDKDSDQTNAEEIINTGSYDELYEIFSKNCQELYSKPLIQKIIVERQKKPITDAKRLADIIRDYYFQNKIRTKTDPSTKIFLGLKIAVNQEFNNLRQILFQSLNSIKSNGTACFISFHSGEDRIIKQFIKSSFLQKKIFSVSKAVHPSFSEVKLNPLSRSSILRSYKIV
ncbi:MAG: 16S rRNA (cytosine(1402)-N(4))-methyltransferase RsmH [Candidatus Shapirobacteria bacterium]|nr:16S rRNA (cytosine(1402)-N(4))-methyltransferase RsmH [Candidatus Shapirobacteria bacterium]